MPSFRDIDPEWAWQPYEPSRERPWDRKLVSHLYRRAGLGATTSEIESSLRQSPEEVVGHFLNTSASTGGFEAAANGLARTILASGDPKRLSAAWVYRLLHTPHQLLEKMTLFWHGHFATSAEKVQNAHMMWDQNNLLRQHAIGTFEPMVQGIAQDPAMLIYLDSASNRKSHPNENFARELMELFCLGEGNYTESDVQQLARCFTGWEIKNDKFRKNRYQQDRGEKVVLEKTGEFDGEDGVRLVLEQRAMPLFICRKLVNYFVCDEPDFDDRLLEPLARTFVENDLEIGPVLQKLLSSNLFYSDIAVARKIRSPVEFMLGMLRSLEGTANTIKLAEGLDSVGQGLFYPPNVKGWDGGRSWINSSTLLGRANLVQEILFDESIQFAGGTLEDYLSKQGIQQPADVIEWLARSLMAVPLSTAQREQLVEQLESENPRDEGIRRALHAITTLPEFHIG